MPSNRLPVAAGAILTIVSTTALWVLPLLVPVDQFKTFVFTTTGMIVSGNPFTQFRVFGGIPGGILAGYLARSRHPGKQSAVAMKCGIYAALLGLPGMIALFALFNVANSIVTGTSLPSPQVVVFPTLIAIPLLPVYLLEGAVFGAVGSWLR